jgi:hypothetical protein
MDEKVLRDTEEKVEDDIDDLFKLALPEFTGARNDLAARLKREGRANDANLVKALAKPSVSAWAVNQLYWKHREAFDRLLATSQHIRQTQSSQTAGRIADMRGSLDARSEALTQLTDLATVLLRDAGHNPSPDTLHRITTTLEALSAYATLSGGPTPGRLTQDVDPPGFGSLASLIPGTDRTKGNDKLTKVTPSQGAGSAETKTRQKASPPPDKQGVRQAEEARQARMAAAKVLLQEAKKSLTEARSSAQRLEAAKKKTHAEAKAADAEARQAEKRLREAEGRFKKASAASQDAAARAQRSATEAEAAAQALEDAERNLEKVSKDQVK